MRRFFTALILATLASTLTTAQEKAIAPLTVPMSFSGTYGELRHNHFHQGVDWRVGGKVGDPIHAIKSGWIARVSVSNTGYGNAVYINHYDGTTSVYGHMLSFREDLAERVLDEQYINESFAVTIEFNEDEYPVNQGDIIGKVGNTGSSGGPHLHMEVRDTEKNLPMNYISMGYYTPIDNMSPHFRRTFFYGLDTTCAVPQPYKVASIYNPQTYKGTLLLPNISYVAIDAYDQQDGTPGKLAVEEYSVSLDGDRLFYFKVGDVGYTESHYISSLVQQGEGGADLVKSRMDPGNLLAIKAETEGDGSIILNDYDLHTLKITAVDEHGNSSSVRFLIRRSDEIAHGKHFYADTTAQYASWLWYMPNRIDNEEFSYVLPAGALTSSANVKYKIVSPSDASNGILSNVWSINVPTAALQESGTVTFKCQVPEELEGKTFIAHWFNGSLSYAGPRVGFGAWCLAFDTEAPVIAVDQKGRYTVKDDRSGISSVRLEIDGEWHLHKFYRGFVTILDRSSISRGTHKMKITATDRCGNSSTFEKTVQF